MAEIVPSPPGGSSKPIPNPFPHPVNPHDPPAGMIDEPPAVSTSYWQEQWYDPTSKADMSAFKKLGAGPASIDTGRMTGEDFPSTGMWSQV